MKTLRASLLVAIALAALVGCQMTQKRVAYNTLYSVEKTTTAAFDGYLDMVIKGKVPTNDVPRVGRAFNTFQASMLVALDAVQFNTNALAPASLVTESQDLLNLITTLTK